MRVGQEQRSDFSTGFRALLGGRAALGLMLLASILSVQFLAWLRLLHG